MPQPVEVDGVVDGVFIAARNRRCSRHHLVGAFLAPEEATFPVVARGSSELYLFTFLTFLSQRGA